MINARVAITQAAQEQMRQISTKSDYMSVRKVLLSLENTNEAHPAYNPDYPAAPAPIPCRVAYAGNYSLYFVLQNNTVVVFAVEPSKADPRARFAHIEEPQLLEQSIQDAVGESQELR